MKHFAVVALLYSFIAANSCAQTSDVGDLCIQGGQIQQNICMAEEYRKADEHLNIAYKKLVSELVEPKGITSSQDAWLLYRDAECSEAVFQLPMGGGSLTPIAKNYCLLKLTQERTRRLEWHLEQDCNNCPPRQASSTKFP